MIFDEKAPHGVQRIEPSPPKSAGQPEAASGQRPSARRFSPGGLLAVTLVGIALAETAAMLVIYFVRDLPYYQQVLLDAGLLMAIIFPLLYFLSFKPLILQIRQHDQTEATLRQSEEKFRTLVDWTYDWEMWVDPNGQIVYTSPSSERITGYSPAELLADPQLTGRLVHPDDQAAYQEHQEYIHDPQAETACVEYRILTRDGSERWIEHICRPLFAPDGGYLGRRISNREITERKQSEQQITRQAQNEAILTQTLRTIQTDIARDLHDTLGQNLGFIRMNLQNVSEGSWEDLERIQTRVQHMVKVADDSYELVRSMLAVLQMGGPADPVELFTHYADQIAQRSSFEIKITSQGEPQPLSPNQVRQLLYIFREGLSNIEKHAGASQAAGQFTWHEDFLSFELADDGRGFTPHNGRSRSGFSGGLSGGFSGHYGLSFMRDRAERLQGKLSIQSAPGEGTTLRVVAPYEPAPTAGAADAPMQPR